MLLDRREPVPGHFFVVVYEGDEVATGSRDAGIQRIGLSRLRFVQISQSALEAWPEAANNARRPIGGPVVHHEHPHLESARHLGGEEALERPGQERLAIERRQDHVDDHQMLPRVAGRWPWPPPARTPWRRTTRRRPVRWLIPAWGKDPPPRRTWTPILRADRTTQLRRRRAPGQGFRQMMRRRPEAGRTSR